jgi:hypothetical protein
MEQFFRFFLNEYSILSHFIVLFPLIIHCNKPFLDILCSEFTQKLNGEIQTAYRLSQTVLPIMKG